jgi:hypothetical protein
MYMHTGTGCFQGEIGPKIEFPDPPSIYQVLSTVGHLRGFLMTREGMEFRESGPQLCDTPTTLKPA